MKINFGCGNKSIKGWVNVDKYKNSSVQIACDMDKFPYPFKDNSADVIMCNMVLEHIQHPTKALNEFNRIIKDDGVVKVIVPHFTSPTALLGDIHRIAFPVGFFYMRETFEKEFLMNKHQEKWESPDIKGYWKDVKIKIKFPRGYLIVPSLIFEAIFSRNKYLQILYELAFSTFYRADEIQVELRKKEKI